MREKEGGIYVHELMLIASHFRLSPDMLMAGMTDRSNQNWTILKNLFKVAGRDGELEKIAGDEGVARYILRGLIHKITAEAAAA